jgi:transaldolase
MTTVLKESPLRLLTDLGQSIWIDYIDRGMIREGRLRAMIEDDGVTGVTSNPAIFEKAITGHQDYDEDIARYVAAGSSAAEIYRLLTVKDIHDACDVLSEIYERTEGRNGYASLEVSPHLARDERGTVEEARSLWCAVNRPNLFIKIPATKECLPAIRQCISDGINVNVTLLFALPRYREVVQAYLEGLEAREALGQPLGSVASVASFFISRIDAMVDPVLDGTMDGSAGALRGQVAIACAKTAYQIGRNLFSSPRFAELERSGARAQRLLWASTSTKDPAYGDVKYVEALIGSGTIDTMPPETLDAFRDHGRAAATLEAGVTEAADVLNRLSDFGIRLDDVTQRLEEEGIEKFNKPYDAVLTAIRKKGASA